MAGVVPDQFPAHPPADAHSTDPHATDPDLLREHSEFKTYKTSRFEYRNIRVFFRQHVKAHELPRTPAPLPLLVCIPGLGGSAAQFHPLLKSLVDLAPCLALDWPGGGRSEYTQTSWEAYSSQALLELLEVVIEDHRDKEAGQGVVLIGHSMGTVLAAALANKKAKHEASSLAEHVVGLIAICPASGDMAEATANFLAKLLWVPGWLFSLWRAWDGRGGTESASVSRFVGDSAEPLLKMLQYRFNSQSRTPVWRRMAGGALPAFRDGKRVAGIPGPDVWAGLDIPVYLIAGESDHVTSPKEVDKILKAMGEDGRPSSSLRTDVGGEQQTGEADTDAIAAPMILSPKLEDHIPHIHDGFANEDIKESINSSPHADNTTDTDTNTPTTPVDSRPELPPQPQHPHKIVKSIILHSPANHTLLYTPRSVRALAGLVSDFLATHVTQRLSLAWQLQHLSRAGKWDVKNLAKWQSVTPVSGPIGPEDGPAVFRVTKTLREADDEHSPRALVARWGGVIKDLIDLTKDQPVYDPRGLERSGIHYHKFPTVSKMPPEGAQVDGFIRLVDSLREAQRARAAAEGWENPEQCVVGVHCHYGYNRSGYFVVCYLVERCGFALPDAIETFRKAKPNGIRHSHFLDKLYMRYNLEQASE